MKKKFKKICNLIVCMPIQTLTIYQRNTLVYADIKMT